MTTLSRLLCSAAPALVALCGCAFQSDLLNARSQNRVLMEQSRAQLAEIENLKAHNRRVEDQLIRTEEEVAMIEQRLGVERRQLANFERERDALTNQFAGIGRGNLPPGLSGRLANLAQRYPNLAYDPSTGISKLELDVLFDSGQAELKSDAEAMLNDFAAVMQSSEARDFRVMVVGHTDDQKIKGRETRRQYPDNWHLSTARALAVVNQLRQAGMSEQRLGIAGFSGYQPVAANESSTDRHRNRRVEIFVVGPETPVVGWTESTPNLYR